ncbi:hypothetical protein GGE46_004540 [Rhizobium etli]|uniref:Uncharacterized protein n=1 Tax=Rhizobium etli TaxID=29449 RepID=A0A7W6VCV8_RHIET|nr:hypothetical protein [Rhizobium etli]MBB4537767.1 hypothetical protein [Rhizobium etli]
MEVRRSQWAILMRAPKELLASPAALQSGQIIALLF